jgi:ADP-ribose pyrophosphatase
MTAASADPTRIEIIADRTNDVGPDEGFLRLKRFRVQNVYADGTRSAPYDCDVISRRQPDAVAVLLYGRDDKGRVHVVLRSGVRPAVYLRRHKQFVQPDVGEHLLLVEMTAGLLEDEDTGPEGVARRAAAEAKEEAGFDVPVAKVQILGAALFPTPGISDEKVFYRAAEVDLDAGASPAGDGSVMEEAGAVVVMPLLDAIQRCRSGAMPDMKTEVALLRLCHLVGYVPALDCFLEDLPPDARRRAVGRGRLGL